MSWTTITAAHLNDTKVAKLVDALRTKALAAGQSDPVPAITASVVARIRAEVAGSAKNTLDQDAAKIPDDLKGLACRMIIREAMSRLQLELTDDEREEQRNDLRYLERIARGEVPVSRPDTAEATPTVQAGAAAQMVTSRPGRKVTVQSLEGL